MKGNSPEQHHGQFVAARKYLPEFVYGGIDGSVTTFAVVAGAAGADLGVPVVLILGFANLFADGFSMSVGNFLSIRSEIDNYHRHRRIEEWEVDHLPDEERDEIRTSYREKGFEGELLEKVVEVITSDKPRWVDVMMKDELQMTPPSKSPYLTAGATFLSFLTIGFIPLLAYVLKAVNTLPSTDLFLISCIATGLAFAFVGFMKSYVTGTCIARSVLETLLLGGIAAALAYFVGDVLERLLA